MSVVRQPTETEWDAATRQGGSLVKKSVGRRVLSILEHRQNPSIATGVMFGALHEVCLMAAVGCPEQKRHVLEQHLLAIVRGVVRGLEHPVQDNGMPFRGVLDA